MAPNIAADCRTLATAETLKMLFSNSRGLMTGSAARSSRTTNATHMTAEKTNRPMICQRAPGVLACRPS